MDFLSIDLTPISWDGLIASLLCGSIIGLERQLKGKAIGIRTSSLICLGTYVFAAVGTILTSGMYDPTRIVGQIVTGIGFLGAGVIITRKGSVSGITSASVIWVLAAIGVMIGVGKITAAVTLAIISVCILVGVDLFERFLIWMGKSFLTHVKSLRKMRIQEEPDSNGD